MKWMALKGFLIFFITIGSFAVTWSELRGCYKTISYNGAKLADTSQNYSIINLNENPLFFLSAEEEEYLVHSAVLYRGEKSHHHQDIYIEDGITSKSSDYLRNNFKGYVRYRFSPDKVLKLTNQFSVRQIEGSAYEVIVFKNIDFKGQSFLESGRFVLQKIGCYNDIITEDIFSRGIELPFELEI